MTQQRWRLDGQTALITGASAGIGLAIAHEAVEHFGGRLSFLNRPGGGLKVAITLPLLKAP